MTRMSPLPPRSLQISLVSSVPRLDFVRGDESGLRAQSVDVGRLAVDVDERNASVGGELGHGRGRGSVDGVDNDCVDMVRDEVLDLAELLGDVVLGVLDVQSHPWQGFGIVYHAVAQNGEEVVVELVHRYADIGGEGRIRERRCGGEPNQNAFHFRFLPRRRRRRRSVHPGPPIASAARVFLASIAEARISRGIGRWLPM